MNNLKSIISFITILILTLLSIFLIYQKEIRKSNLLKSLEEINYYSKAHQNITNKIDEYLINTDLKEEYLNYYNIDLLKKDIKNKINNQEISHYNELRNIASKYTNDNIIIYKYASLVEEIINNNLFLDMTLLNKTYISSSNVLFIMMVTSLIVLLLLIISNNNKTIVLSLLILLILPKVFFKVTNLLTNFIYTNQYFTSFILKIIYNIINQLFIIGILLIICISIKSILIKIKK